MKSTFLFRHIGPGEARPVGQFKTQVAAATYIQTAYPRAVVQKYTEGIQSVVWSNRSEPYHIVTSQTLEEAQEVATRRAWIAEAKERLNARTLMQIPIEQLRVICDILPGQPLKPGHLYGKKKKKNQPIQLFTNP